MLHLRRVLSFNVWSGAILTNNEFKSVVALSPLASNQRCFADILDRFPGPLDRPDNRMVVCSHDRLQNRSRFAQVLGALQDIDGHLKKSVLKSDRLSPRPCS